LGKKQKVIVDTNILIDLCVGDLFEEFFSLSYIVFIPDVIKEEYNNPVECIKTIRRIRNKGLSSKDVEKIYEFFKEHPSLSVGDIFAFWLAKKERAILLTGDGKLKKLANKYEVEVHGILWIMDNIYEKNSKNGKKLLRALKKILNRGSRLPEKECKKREERWKVNK